MDYFTRTVRIIYLALCSLCVFVSLSRDKDIVHPVDIKRDRGCTSIITDCSSSFWVRVLWIKRIRRIFFYYYYLFVDLHKHVISHFVFFCFLETGDFSTLFYTRSRLCQKTFSRPLWKFHFHNVINFRQLLTIRSKIRWIKLHIV